MAGELSYTERFNRWRPSSITGKVVKSALSIPFDLVDFGANIPTIYRAYNPEEDPNADEYQRTHGLSGMYPTPPEQMAEKKSNASLFYRSMGKKFVWDMGGFSLQPGATFDEAEGITGAKGINEQISELPSTDAMGAQVSASLGEMVGGSLAFLSYAKMMKAAKAGYSAGSKVLQDTLFKGAVQDSGQLANLASKNKVLAGMASRLAPEVFSGAAVNVVPHLPGLITGKENAWADTGLDVMFGGTLDLAFAGVGEHARLSFAKKAFGLVDSKLNAIDSQYNTFARMYKSDPAGAQKFLDEINIRRIASGGQNIPFSVEDMQNFKSTSNQRVMEYLKNYPEMQNRVEPLVKGLNDEIDNAINRVDKKKGSRVEVARQVANLADRGFFGPGTMDLGSADEAIRIGQLIKDSRPEFMRNVHDSLMNYYFKPEKTSLSNPLGDKLFTPEALSGEIVPFHKWYNSPEMRYNVQHKYDLFAKEDFFDLPVSYGGDEIAFSTSKTPLSWWTNKKEVADYFREGRTSWQVDENGKIIPVDPAGTDFRLGGHPEWRGKLYQVGISKDANIFDMHGAISGKDAQAIVDAAVEVMGESGMHKGDIDSFKSYWDKRVSDPGRQLNPQHLRDGINQLAEHTGQAGELSFATVLEKAGYDGAIIKYGSKVPSEKSPGAYEYAIWNDGALVHPNESDVHIYRGMQPMNRLAGEYESKLYESKTYHPNPDEFLKAKQNYQVSGAENLKNASVKKTIKEGEDRIVFLKGQLKDIDKMIKGLDPALQAADITALKDSKKPIQQRLNIEKEMRLGKIAIMMENPSRNERLMVEAVNDRFWASQMQGPLDLSLDATTSHALLPFKNIGSTIIQDNDLVAGKPLKGLVKYGREVMEANDISKEDKAVIANIFKKIMADDKTIAAREVAEKKAPGELGSGLISQAHVDLFSKLDGIIGEARWSRHVDNITERLSYLFDTKLSDEARTDLEKITKEWMSAPMDAKKQLKFSKQVGKALKNVVDEGILKSDNYTLEMFRKDVKTIDNFLKKDFSTAGLADVKAMDEALGGIIARTGSERAAAISRNFEVQKITKNEILRSVEGKSSKKEVGAFYHTAVFSGVDLDALMKSAFDVNESPVLHALIQNMRAGQAKRIGILDDARKYHQDVLNRLAISKQVFDSWSNHKEAWQLADDTVIEATTDEIQNLYLMSKDPRVANIINKTYAKGNETVMLGGEARKLSLSDVKDLTDQLSATEAAYAQHIFDYSNTTLRNHENAHWRDMYGYPLTTWNDWWHIRYERNRTIENQLKEKDFFGWLEKMYVNKSADEASMLRERDATGGLLRNDGLRRTFHENSETVSVSAGLQKPYSQMLNILRDTDVQKAFGKSIVGGTQIAQEAISRLSVMANTVVAPHRKSPIYRLYKAMMHNTYVAALGDVATLGSLKTLTLQMLGSLNPFMLPDVSVGRYLKALPTMTKRDALEIEEVLSRNVLLKHRIEQSGQTPVHPNPSASVGIEHFYGDDKPMSPFMANIGKFDAIGCKKAIVYALDEGKANELSGNALYDYAAERSYDIISRTQPTNDPMSMSIMHLRGSEGQEFYDFFSRFYAQLGKYHTQIYKTITDLSKGRIGASDAIRPLGTALITIPAAVATVQFLYKKLSQGFEQQDKENDPMDLAMQSIRNTASVIPVFGKLLDPMISFMYTKYGKGSYQPETLEGSQYANPFMPIITAVGNTTTGMIELVQAYNSFLDKETFKETPNKELLKAPYMAAEATRKLVNGLGFFAGVPIAGTVQQFKFAIPSKPKDSTYYSSVLRDSVKMEDPERLRFALTGIMNVYDEDIKTERMKKLAHGDILGFALYKRKFLLGKLEKFMLEDGTENDASWISQQLNSGMLSDIMPGKEMLARIQQLERYESTDPRKLLGGFLLTVQEEKASKGMEFTEDEKKQLLKFAHKVSKRFRELKQYEHLFANPLEQSMLLYNSKTGEFQDEG
jgi:hypothetical protein